MVQQSPFEVLEISEGFSFENLKARYVEMVRKYPPEKNPEEFMKIRQAYDFFSAPGKHDAFMYFAPLGYINENTGDVKHPQNLLKTHFEMPFSAEADLKSLLALVNFEE